MAKKRKTPPAEIVEDAKPRRARRLRVVADDKGNGVYGPIRDVYLESRAAGETRWAVELFNFKVSAELTADMIRFAAAANLPVRYEPAGNMAAYFLRFRQDQPELFE